ncbi:MAG: alkaline phosphatase family protein [Thermoanaerobaculia bacterium]
MRELRPLLPSLLALALLACGGAEAPRRPRWVVIGVDGAERTVVEALWAEGKLPVLHELADRGLWSGLATDFGISPVIWTTVATGVDPETHGITGFAISTPDGDAPVSSTLRRVPALWNMLTAAGRAVDVVSWWATWPAEPIAGVMVSDRAGLGVGNEVTPPEMEGTWRQWAAAADRGENAFPGDDVAQRDRRTAAAAERLAAGHRDLLMAYFRDVDVTCHVAWKGWEPERFPPQDPAEEAALRARVVGAYEATDEAIGRILAAAGPGVNVLVLSDHGFHAKVPERGRVAVDLDEILEGLGYQARDAEGGIDWSRTSLYTYEAPPFRSLKKVRCATVGREPEGRFDATACAEARRRLEADLPRITYASGLPVLGLRDATDEERAAGADFMVVVAREEPSTSLQLDGRPWRGFTTRVSRLSGTHSPHWAGIVLAAGPDVDPHGDIRGMSVRDIAPTLLYGLGLPVGEDFTGRVRFELFRDEVRRSHRLRTVESWGRSAPGEAAVSAADEELLQELRALGYIE